MKDNIHEHLMVVKMLLINIAILGGVTIADVEMWLKIIVLLLTLGYTVWKWYREIITARNGK